MAEIIKNTCKSMLMHYKSSIIWVTQAVVVWLLAKNYITGDDATLIAWVIAAIWWSINVALPKK